MSELIKRALVFAFNAHAGQRRKYTGAPYIVHPISVMATLQEHGVESPTELAAALLHDVVEDCGVRLGDLEDQFGDRVMILVEDLTDQFTKQNYPHLNRAARKEREQERLARVSEPAARIKLADLIDNSRGMDPADKFTDVYLQEKAALVPLLARAHAGGAHQELVKTALFELGVLQRRRESTKS
jgi:(p)ppGpp synthase/HD superfamily hydrolase